MVARRIVVVHAGDEIAVDCDTDLGVEVLRIQIFSLTDVPPDEQLLLAEGAEGVAVGDDADLAAISDRLRLLPRSSESAESAPKQQETSDEELARLLQAEEEILLLQQYSVNGDGSSELRGRLDPYVGQVLLYDDAARQEAARKTVPVDELLEKALVSLAKDGNLNPSKDEENHAFLLQLLSWFKQSFRWVNAPPCYKCDHETSSIGMGSPLADEIKYGGSRVELYRCKQCMSITRFPRYNDPYKLLETRRGRCGEWANCFTLYCRSFGYESRLILDFTDHVWTECFSDFLGRWMHLDPCEGVYDRPLLYEQGWNKKLNYVFGISRDGVYDVTKRYTRKWHEVLSRRILTTEDQVSLITSSITKQCRSAFTFKELENLVKREQKEQAELDRGIYLQVDGSISLPGRQSGSLEWRVSRSEVGQSAIGSLSCSSCPIRQCFDIHVSKIYNSLADIISHMSESENSASRIRMVLDILKMFLFDLKGVDYKIRKGSVDLSSCQLSEKIISCIEQLFATISMKVELGPDGVLSVCVQDNPIQTSLALPVAIDAVDEIIGQFNSGNTSTSDNIFLKSNRLSLGSVLASGEELPVGIATAAFDGLRMSKWEEPNGAEGCWLIYQTHDGHVRNLDSYDLVSANDAPERDPMSWILEGSADGGATWLVIDERNSQLFESRFLRKSYKLMKTYSGNAYRFKFLRVRDPTATSRFQIASIDLYGSTDDTSALK